MKAEDLGPAAATVIAYYDTALHLPGNDYATGQATAAVAVWCELLRDQDPQHAVGIARTIVDRMGHPPDWRTPPGKAPAAKP